MALGCNQLWGEVVGGTAGGVGFYLGRLPLIGRPLLWAPARWQLLDAVIFPACEKSEKNYGNHHFFWGIFNYKWPFSIACLATIHSKQPEIESLHAPMAPIISIEHLNCQKKRPGLETSQECGQAKVNTWASTRSCDIAQLRPHGANLPTSKSCSSVVESFQYGSSIWKFWEQYSVTWCNMLLEFIFGVVIRVDCIVTA